MKNILNLINKNIGETAMIGLAGSRLYGTNHESSDHDYFAFIKNSNNLNDRVSSEYKKGDIDIFYLPIESVNRLSVCATPLILFNIANTIYAKEPLNTFIKNNRIDLMHIAPYYTYGCGLQLIEHDLEWKMYKRILTLVDIFKTFYRTNDFSKCVPVSSNCKKQIRDIHYGKEWTREMILKEIDFLYSKSFKDFMKSFPTNYKLHNEFINITNNLEV